MHRQLILFFIFLGTFSNVTSKERYLSKVESNLETFCELTSFFTDFLEDFNDRHIGGSEWGKVLGYEDIKPKISDDDGSRGIKKMSMAMMPLVFHVGATSTWMILTSIMAVKSVAIGLILLVFKIAVSSAKVASFFTLLKSKHSEHHEIAWPHHGSDRSLSHKEIPIHDEWNSYTPVSSPSDPYSGYKTIPLYKENHISDEEFEFEDPKKHAKKKNG